MNLVRLCMITASGGALEFFDFTIFMLFGRYIAGAFFPESNPVAGTISVALLFFTGYAARPLGGVLSCHFGDRYGRKKLFMITIGVMSLATLGIGLLPAYAQWGQLSLYLLVALRLLQGLAVGGEIPGSTTFAAEHVAPPPRGLITGIIIAAITFGNLFGSALGWLLNSLLSQEAMEQWGWRVPFILGGLLGGFGLLARVKIFETPVFLALSQSGCATKVPLWILLKSHWRQALSGMVFASVTATVVSVFLYLPTYFELSSLGAGINAFQLTTIGFLLYSVLTVPFAWLSDRIGRRKQLMIGALILLPASLAGIWLTGRGGSGGYNYFSDHHGSGRCYCQWCL